MLPRHLFFVLLFTSICSSPLLQVQPAVKSGSIIHCSQQQRVKQEKLFLKKEKRGKTGTTEFADMAFNIAECYRSKNDTTASRIWYGKSYTSYMFFIMRCDKCKHVDEIKRMGLCRFYTNYYKEASTCFIKAISASNDPESTYFLALCQIKQEHYAEALIELNNFKNLSDDKRDADELIETCKQKINSNK